MCDADDWSNVNLITKIIKQNMWGNLYEWSWEIWMKIVGLMYILFDEED